LTSCAVGHIAAPVSAAIVRRPRQSTFIGSFIVTATLMRLFTIVPALVLTLLYGRATGDVGNSHAVIALLLGMGIGSQVGSRSGAES
jgi:hypothetical protein